MSWPNKSVLKMAIEFAYLKANSDGVGKVFPLGPKCKVGDKIVDCFSAASPHGGITSDILVDLFTYLDHLDVFPRTEGIPDPFIVIDGHNSRFGLQFLQYINDPKHRWAVNIGVPYGTHLWQVGDAAELNGSYKIGLTRAKEELNKHRRARYQPLIFKPTDVMPLTNKAWRRSFGDTTKGVKALSKRGWNPCNRMLLTEKDVLKTKLATDTEMENADTLVLNVDTGTAADIVDMLKERQCHLLSRARGLKRKNEAAETASLLDNAKKVTSGVLWRTGSTLLGPKVLEHVEAYTARKLEEEKKKLDNKLAREEKLQAAIAEVKSKRQEDWKLKDYKLMCRYKWRDGDLKMPTKLNELKDLWELVKDRPDPVGTSTTSDEMPPLNPLNADGEGAEEDAAMDPMLADAAATADDAIEVELTTAGAAAAI